MSGRIDLSALSRAVTESMGIRRTERDPINVRGPLILPGRNRRRARKGERVRNLWGKSLPCCWTECWEPGSTQHQVTVPHDAPERANSGDTLTYVFCSPEHLGYWLSGAMPGDHFGDRLSGRKSPLGLIIP